MLPLLPCWGSGLEPWSFDVVLTVCDDANAACPAYAAKTARLHAAFPDPIGKDLAAWREVRDAVGETMRRLAEALARGEMPRADELGPDAGRTPR